MKKLHVAFCAALLVGPVAIDAQNSAPPADGSTAPKPVLRSEATRNVAQDFARHDTDHDGYLSPQEWDKSNEGDPDLGNNGQRVFAIMDANGDKRLSQQEIENWMLGIFDCLDENHNAQLTDQEVRQNGDRCLKAGGLSKGPDRVVED